MIRATLKKLSPLDSPTFDGICDRPVPGERFLFWYQHPSGDANLGWINLSTVEGIYRSDDGSWTIKTQNALYLLNEIK